jgi:SSS family solute:Na+ symporter
MDLTILTIAVLYFFINLVLGFWVARGEKKEANEYFLGGRKLPWYVISLSMTGANIGTEHFIGMVGTAYAVGLAPATFEWGNFIPYSVLIWIFMPYFYRKKLFTIPEFLERRYSQTTRAVFATFTLLHMVFVVLAPALYAGGRILYEMILKQQATSLNWGFMLCTFIIVGITGAYCIYGGFLSVAWTTVLQTAILLAGGILLVLVGSYDFGGITKVIETNLQADSSRFSLILPVSHPVSPWTGVATFWFTLSMWYVGTNQFYIQRCLGAKSEWDAKMGVVGCAFLKVFLPFIIVFPGLIAFAKFGPGLPQDAVYVKMINEFLPPLGRGIMLAVLVAAIMSTVSSILNSASTIWSIDIHKRLLNKDASETDIVKIGRISTFIFMLIGTLFAPILLYWRGGIFIYIQDMAAFFAPPISVIFLSAFLWRKAHSRAATFTLISGIIIGVILKIIGETWGVSGIEQLKPLLNRAAVSWVLCLIALIGATFLIPKNIKNPYDPDVIWNKKWAKLPESERSLNSGWRNLTFWWILMVITSTSLFVIFR